MRTEAIIFAATLLMAPLDARAADLVVWWDKGLYELEDQAVRDMVAAFERQSGERVELVLVPQGQEFTAKLEEALAAGSPPDLARGGPCCLRADRWAANGLLVDLSDVVLPLRRRFLPGLLEYTFLPDPKTGIAAPFTAPFGQFGHYIHVWTSLLRRAGFGLEDIPEPRRRSGRSGATKFSRRSAELSAVMTSGAWASRCRPVATRWTPSSSS